MNLITISGKLQNDPKPGSGDWGEYANFNIINSISYRDSKKELQERNYYFNCFVTSDLVDEVKELKMDDEVIVSGSLKNRKNSDGTYSAFIHVRELYMIPNVEKRAKPGTKEELEEDKPLPKITQDDGVDKPPKEEEPTI